MYKAGREVCVIKTSLQNPRNGEAAFIRLKDGGILMAYSRFGGEGGDHDGSRLCAVISRDEGETWSEPKEMFDGDRESRNNMSPSLVRMKDGNIGLCYLRKSTARDGLVLCMPVFRYSADEGKSWSGLTFCAEEPGYYCGTNAASVILASGRIVTPVAHNGPGMRGYSAAPGPVRFFCSDDCGKTWLEAMAPLRSPYSDGAQLQEPGLFELPDGALWCYTRTLYGFQYQAFSYDGGKSWTLPEPNLCVSSPDAPMRVTDTGRCAAAVFNPSGHSPARGDTTPWGGGRRNPLVAALSFDGGASLAVKTKEFSWQRLSEFKQSCVILEDNPAGHFCYPAIIGTNDGFLVSYYCGAGSKVLDYCKITKVTYAELEACGLGADK